MKEPMTTGEQHSRVIEAARQLAYAQEALGEALHKLLTAALREPPHTKGWVEDALIELERVPRYTKSALKCLGPLAKGD